MKRALTIGCGSGNGRIIVDTLLNHGYTVTNMGSSEHPGCDNISVTWQDLDITNLHKIYRPGAETLDFVFFNQNASSLASAAFVPGQDTLQVWRLIKNWQHTHWVSCQMPILLLHYVERNLRAHSKIGWMLSSMMCYDRAGVESYPDYSSQKYFNYLAMKSFSQHYQTFGIMPDFTLPDSDRRLAEIVARVCETPVNAATFKMGSHDVE